MTGVARHYRGEAPTDYYDYQGRIGELGADLNRFKFERYVRSADDVVDFGCGGGGLLAGLDARSKVGVEVSEPARAVARSRGLVVVAAASELPTASADVVISNHALEHTLAPLDELRELRRVLRPTGRVVLWLPLDDWRNQRRPGPDPDHHLYTWTPKLLRNILEEAGFDGVEARVVTHAWPPATALLARRIPRPVFDVLARLWSVVRRRRQLAAVAVAGSSQPVVAR